MGLRPLASFRMARRTRPPLPWGVGACNFQLAHARDAPLGSRTGVGGCNFGVRCILSRGWLDGVYGDHPRAASPPTSIRAGGRRVTPSAGRAQLGPGGRDPGAGASGGPICA